MRTSVDGLFVIGQNYFEVLEQNGLPGLNFNLIEDLLLTEMDKRTRPYIAGVHSSVLERQSRLIIETVFTNLDWQDETTKPQVIGVIGETFDDVMNTMYYTSLHS